MRLVAVLAALSVALLASPARAQHDPAAAESLFRDAKSAEARGDYKAACPLFAESQRLDPAPGTLLNLGDCEEHLGAVASAWGHFVEARDSLPKGDDRIPFAQQRASALEPRVPHLVVRLPAGAPAGTKVTRGRIEIGAAALGVPMAVDPGTIVLTATPPGGATVSKSIPIGERETKDIMIELAPAAAPPAASASAPAIPAPPVAPAPPAADHGGGPAAPGDGKRTLAWIVGGVGVAGLAVGAVTGALAMGDANTVKSNCPGGACKDPSGIDAASAGKTASTISTAGIIGGAVLTGIGVYLLLTSGPPGPSTAVGAAPLPGGASFGVVRTF